MPCTRQEIVDVVHNGGRRLAEGPMLVGTLELAFESLLSGDVAKRDEVSIGLKKPCFEVHVDETAVYESATAHPSVVTPAEFSAYQRDMVRLSLMLADTPEDRHGSYAPRKPRLDVPREPHAFVVPVVTESVQDAWRLL